MPHFIVCGEDTYPACGKHPDRAGIGVFDLLVVVRGCLYLKEEPHDLDVSGGHYAVLRPDRAHRTVRPCGEETSFYWLHFHTTGRWGEWGDASEAAPVGPAMAGELEPFAFDLPRAGAVRDREAAYGKLRELLQSQSDAGAEARWRQQQLFHELLSQLRQENEPAERPPLLLADRAAAFLRQHYSEPLSYKRLSEALHFHANYISLCMKKAYGCTPLDYLTRYRVEQAKRMLIRTDDPIGRIAEATGFGSFPYFVRCFSRYAGCRPREFRMRHR
jgi:AraC-like DNA-binding protein